MTKEQKKFDTEAIIASTNLVELASRYVELKPDGREYKGLCVNHADTDPSMFVVPEKQFVHCFSCGFHENAIGFLMHVEQIDFVNACKRLTGEIGALPDPKPLVKRELKKAPPRRTFAPPADKLMPDMELKGLGQPIAVWTYRTLTGQPLGYVARYASTERKEIRCWTWGNRADHDVPEWSCGHFSEPRPLYGQEKLIIDDKQIILVEGEKTADAAAKLFPKHQVLTWPGGANAVSKVDWTLLKNRKVVLIPDNDEAGRQAMERVAAYLYANGAEQVKGIDVETQPDGTPTVPGWDLADADGWTAESTWEWARTRVLTYPNIQPETPTAAPEPIPTTQDTSKPAPTQPAPVKSKPSLGVVDGNTVRKPRIQEIEAEAELPPEFSESGMARAWVEKHGENWRFTAKWRAWHQWDGTTWVQDQKNSITWVIDEHCREMQAEARELTPTQRSRICTIKNFNAINSLSGANPMCATAADDWDANPFLLGTPAGIIDLKTGQSIGASREQLISKKTSIAPAEGPHPWWDSVLARAHKGDAGVAKFIQKWCGYLLTGDTREERFLFIHGPGGGGKSKFLTPIVEIMGDYCRTAKIESFTAKDRSEHSEEIARLVGARLVTASETEDGTRWNESRIKQLTGRDKIAARHMHQSTFEFQPQFKLVFVGNHKPALRSVGEEMRRRIDMLEWSGSIPQDERILDLPERLKAEYPAILHWMIQGAMLWMQEGLQRPVVISTSTDDYLTGEDTIGAWIDDCIELSDGCRTPSQELYESFKRWTDKNGEFCPSQKRFSQKLEDRGYAKYRNSSGRGFTGIRVKLMDDFAGY